MMINRKKLSRFGMLNISFFQFLINMDISSSANLAAVTEVDILYPFQRIIFSQKLQMRMIFQWIVLSTESVFSAVGGALFGIDDISTLGYIGCAIIFVGIVISQIPIDQRIDTKTPSGRE